MSNTVTLEARDQAVLDTANRGLDIVDGLIEYFTYSVPGAAQPTNVPFSKDDTYASAMQKAGVPMSDKVTLISGGQTVSPSDRPQSGAFVSASKAVSNG